MDSKMNSNDLPLMANTNDTLVYHYILNLDVQFETSIFRGSITLFLDNTGQNKGSNDSKRIFSIYDYHENKNIDENRTLECAPQDQSKTAKDFTFILDACDLKVETVNEVQISESDLRALLKSRETDLRCNRQLYNSCAKGPTSPLSFSLDKWSIRIRKDGVKSARDFPEVVCIHYSTKPEGKSLRWSTDQDGKACVYTAAMWINNRAFMPCQELGSFSTWQAHISAPGGATVLMSGDCMPETETLGNGFTKFYYECRMPMPTFTLALAVGHWSCYELNQDAKIIDHYSLIDDIPGCDHKQRCHINYSASDVMPCRIFAPKYLLDQAIKVLTEYYPKCCQAVQELMGPHPFWRWDIVIYPSSSQDMALANPNLLFLSQSVLAEDGSLCIKLAHEMTHSWFGLLIGARDWTEEWLSEGFATFLEDYVHARAQGWTAEKAAYMRELQAGLRFHTLTSEVIETSESLQTLRPNVGVDVTSADVAFVKDGLNPNKQFIQVHYLKGYFLLRHLAKLVGEDKFLVMLKEYVKIFHGQMVTSEDFLKFVISSFPEISTSHGIAVKSIYDDWLDCPGIPKPLGDVTPSAENYLFQAIRKEVENWMAFDKHIKGRKRKSSGKNVTSPNKDFNPQLSPIQLVHVLEDLLQEKKLCASTLNQLKSVYLLNRQNSEVRHRWCELVVKNKHKSSYPDVEYFLLNDQAMGVYIYGELMISRCTTLQNLARTCFNRVKSQMEEGTFKIVNQMLYPE